MGGGGGVADLAGALASLSSSSGGNTEGGLGLAGLADTLGGRLGNNNTKVN